MRMQIPRTKRQKRRERTQNACCSTKKSPGRLHTWKNYRKAGGGAYRHQCSCRDWNQQKCHFARLESVPNHSTAVRKVGGGHPRTTTAGDDRYIILQAKRGRRQSASVIAEQLSTAILLKMDKWLKRRKFNDDNSDNDNVRDQVNEPTPAQAQVASYDIAELIAVNLKPHNLAEEIILPACRKIVKTMIGGSADIDIC
ncbi:hypothetical protein TNCV_2338941 [Trichonephila clavipes]|nr:hypothetical protein TNCV_2338941 [Trichonephila clavipes]